MALDIELQLAFDKYFATLKAKGYVLKQSIKQLYTLWIIREILNTMFITEDDYRVIQNVLECLYGTCLIDYPDYTLYIIALPTLLTKEYIRLTELGAVRATEDSGFRTAML